MIKLSSQLCENLGLDYWKLNNNESNEAKEKAVSVFHIAEDQKELLRKILLAINIQLDSSMIQFLDDSKLIILVNQIQLVFCDVNAVDSDDVINLASLQQMQQKQDYKKQTWIKLKRRFL